MTKAAIVARLKKIYAAEDYFTGVLGNRASAFKPRPKPLGSKAPRAEDKKIRRAPSRCLSSGKTRKVK